ncbi:alpha/beta hydrolase fold domain-containing protein [Phenylobacterium sp.]|uniref:alpha/beta hydrolase n=1 Tax=Phenylobacterium sp. TaxID=1871053 RepID=UPI00301B6DD3
MPSPELQAFIEEVRRTRRALLNSDYDPVAFRTALPPSALEAASHIEALRCARIEHRPPERDGRLLAYVSGGGFCFDANDSHRAFVDDIAGRIGASGCLVRYRLAPEAPFPAALDDVDEALDALLSRRRPQEVLLAADSAGAALTLSALMRRRDRGQAMPARLVCLSPLTDMAMTGRSNVSNAEADPLFGPQAVIHKVCNYLQGALPTRPDASPYWGDLTGLPPCLVLAGTTEVMRDDSVRLVDKARAAGVEADLQLVEDAPHTFPLMTLPESLAARDVIAGFLRGD